MSSVVLPPARVLVTGATGFVGRHLWPALLGEGFRVRGLTRNVQRARGVHPGGDWAEGDVGDAGALRAALAECEAAFYLVHAMADGDPGYRQREVEAAHSFAALAAQAGLRRLIYLGGPEPAGHQSEHLRSRLEVGAALRAGTVPALELRASMIVGHGSLSWLIVRDLAARLPVMTLPRWLNSRTQPVGIQDVTAALVRALAIPLPTSGASYDIPGPEVLTGRRILLETAAALGLRPPITVSLPILAPWLSSYWILLVTRADHSVARELINGLTTDLLARDDQFWSLVGHTHLQKFAAAAQAALEAEGRSDGFLPPIRGFWAAVENLHRRTRGLPSRAARAGAGHGR